LISSYRDITIYTAPTPLVNPSDLLEPLAVDVLDYLAILPNDERAISLTGSCPKAPNDTSKAFPGPGGTFGMLSLEQIRTGNLLLRQEDPSQAVARPSSLTHRRAGDASPFF
jgi:hypothetical protein